MGEVLVLLSLFFPGGVAQAQTIPDLVCRANAEVFIDHARLTTSKLESTNLYRFTGGKLYISSEDRDEYLYGAIQEVEPGRYVSSHKTIHFASGQFSKATAVHTNSTATTVLSLRCTRPGGG